MLFKQTNNKPKLHRGILKQRKNYVNNKRKRQRQEQEQSTSHKSFQSLILTTPLGQSTEQNAQKVSKFDQKAMD